MTTNEPIDIPTCLHPQNLQSTTYFTQILPASHHPDEIDRAVRIACMVSVIPIEKLDSAWAIQTLASESRHLQLRLSAAERRFENLVNAIVLSGVGLAVLAMSWWCISAH